MKKIILILLSLGCVNMFNPIQAQFYQNNVPCAANPNNGSAWDWRTPTFTAYMSQPNDRAVALGSPFFQNGLSNQNTLAFQAANGSGRDFEPEDGWELVQKDMGHAPGVLANYSTGRYIQNPYFVLYNKYTGILRIFVALGSSFPTSGRALIELSFATDSPRPSTLDLQSAKTYRNALDERIDFLLAAEQPTIAIANYYSQSIPYWVTADFPMNYDPCTCNDKSQLVFRVWVVNNSTMNFTTVGTLLDNTGQGGGGKFSLTKLGVNTVKAATGAYKTVSDATTAIANIFGVDLKDEDNKISNLLKKTLPGAGAVIGLVDFAVGLFKKDSPPKPLVFNIDLRSTGNINSTNPTQERPVSNPGSFEPIEATDPEPIHYNNIMGIFNVLEKPLVYYSDYPGFFEAQSYRYLLAEDIKYLINPNANFKSPVKIEANWVFEFSRNPSLNTNFGASNLYRQNDTTFVSYPVNIACFNELSVSYSNFKSFTLNGFINPTGSLPRANAFIKLTALLETNEPNSKEILFIGKYPIKTTNGNTMNMSNSLNIFENLSITTTPVTEATFVPVTKAWNRIDINISGVSTISNRTFIAGNEINLKPNGFSNTLLRAGITLEIGDVSQCSGVVYPCNDPINNPDCDSYINVFCRNESGYKFGRGYLPNTPFDGEPVVESASDDGTIKYTTQLYAAYPNPTTEGLVNFTYELAESGNVMLYISNAMGEQVAVLVNNQRQESGTHQFSFDVSQLPSGVYFYTLETNGFKQHKRLVMIR